MTTRKRASNRAPKATPKARLTKKVLRMASSRATAKAHREGFDFLKTQLIAREGWLVRVNSKGEVVEKVEPLMSNKLRKQLKRRA